jgi:hypothetical protein
MSAQIITYPPAQKTPERASPIERARVEVRAALRLAQEPLDVEKVETLARMLSLALADLDEAEQQPQKAA